MTDLKALIDELRKLHEHFTASPWGSRISHTRLFGLMLDNLPDLLDAASEAIPSAGLIERLIATDTENATLKAENERLKAIVSECRGHICSDAKVRDFPPLVCSACQGGLPIYGEHGMKMAVWICDRIAALERQVAAWERLHSYLLADSKGWKIEESWPQWTLNRQLPDGRWSFHAEKFATPLEALAAIDQHEREQGEKP